VHRGPHADGSPARAVPEGVGYLVHCEPIFSVLARDRVLSDATRSGGADQYDPVVAPCTHLDHVLVTELPEECEGCEECLRSGSQWCHLRICLECGHVGCCDSSPNRHATKHAEATGHPLIRSIQPGEEWSWCAVDEVMMVIDGIEGQTRIPPSPLC
jgi:hypothetical protein